MIRLPIKGNREKPSRNLSSLTTGSPGNGPNLPRLCVAGCSPTCRRNSHHFLVSVFLLNSGRGVDSWISSPVLNRDREGTSFDTDFFHQEFLDCHWSGAKFFGLEFMKSDMKSHNSYDNPFKKMEHLSAFHY